ncbi:hypothetical protein ACJMK2_005624 [Sinanodonta woodiana]|uniref:Uncharacterized protein n=1 Tax=Sinanodonta woodiana TaxID=1069815 RepID=A0ABD3VQN3_SINWO
MVSKPINSDSQMDENFSAMFQPPMHFSPDSPPAQISATQDLPVGKTFQYKVNIIYPPDICFLHRNCAGKHLLFIQVHNLCKKIVSIENCLVVPDASPKSLESSNCSGSNFKENHHRQTTCQRNGDCKTSKFQTCMTLRNFKVLKINIEKSQMCRSKRRTDQENISLHRLLSVIKIDQGFVAADKRRAQSLTIRS